jgi:DNA-binding FadR family transcriptional regulator
VERPAGASAPREQRLCDWLYGQILDRILRGEYPPESRLPSEALLGEEFNVSRPVVREALARLREDELVQSRRGSGSFVQRKPQLALARFAPLQSIADVQRCFEFRIGLEEKAAMLAAERHDMAQLAAIDEALLGLDAAIRGGELGHDADFAFHLAVAEASGNRYFPDVLGMLRSHIDFGMQLARTLYLHRSAERMWRVQEEHRAIAAAIRDRDVDQAATAMANHIRNARRRIFEGELLLDRQAS